MLASLKKNPSLSIPFEFNGSDWEMPVEPGVSRFENGGGMGFPSLFHALASLWGTARIRSGEAALMLDHTGEERSKESVYLPHLPGVHVSVRLCPRSTLTLPPIIVAFAGKTLDRSLTIFTDTGEHDEVVV
jgi:hypothetical protein